MATEHPTRRDALTLLAASLMPALCAAQGMDKTPSTRLLASWLLDDRHEVGILDLSPEGATIPHRLALPTRAHGLCSEPEGSVLVAARRPGDWLLRWNPARQNTLWHWVGDDRQLNGHVLRSPDGQHVWTTETDRADAQGLIGVRDAGSLEKVAEWQTHGMDPHAMLVLPQSVGPIPAGTLMVANGGIPTQSETGRSHRDLTRMDPSLVALHPQHGGLLGQWRLDDPRLGTRHLAFDQVSGLLGVALQSEHDDAGSRTSAPLLATWDGQRMCPAPVMPDMLGYGGDICARHSGGFWVSATRAHEIIGTNAAGVIVERHVLRDACALQFAAGRWWAAGSQGTLVRNVRQRNVDGVQLDNHWTLAP